MLGVDACELVGGRRIAPPVELLAGSAIDLIGRILLGPGRRGRLGDLVPGEAEGAKLAHPHAAGGQCRLGVEQSDPRLGHRGSNSGQCGPGLGE